jgi:hypothetical protein
MDIQGHEMVWVAGKWRVTTDRKGPILEPGRVRQMLLEELAATELLEMCQRWKSKAEESHQE